MPGSGAGVLANLSRIGARFPGPARLLAQQGQRLSAELIRAAPIRCNPIRKPTCNTVTCKTSSVGCSGNWPTSTATFSGWGGRNRFGRYRVATPHPGGDVARPGKKPDELASLGKLLIGALKTMLAMGLGARLEGSHREVIDRRPVAAPSPLPGGVRRVRLAYAVRGSRWCPPRPAVSGFRCVSADRICKASARHPGRSRRHRRQYPDQGRHVRRGPPGDDGTVREAGRPGAGRARQRIDPKRPCPVGRVLPRRPECRL